MSKANVMRYFIKLWFSTLKESVAFRVGEEDMERFRCSYQDCRDKFYVSSTYGGTDIAINLKHVEVANLLWDAGLEKDTQSEDDGYWIALHIRNRKPIFADIGEPVDLADILLTLDLGALEPGEVLALTDADGELLMFDPAAILYLEVPTSVVIEGEKEMHKQDGIDDEPK
jgi:hypothetical protein